MKIGDVVSGESVTNGIQKLPNFQKVEDKGRKMIEIEEDVDSTTGNNKLRVKKDEKHDGEEELGGKLVKEVIEIGEE